jgi:nitrate/TMAO reductase-like tetraheme cytochrome c subunit
MFYVVIVLLGLLNLVLLATLLRCWGSMGIIGRLALGSVTFGWLPMVFAVATVSSSIESMKAVEFCNSCHVMESYVASLQSADEASIPAVHYQNNYVSQKIACYDCHREYIVFGGVKAKIAGLRHVWTYYTDNTPDTIQLYKAYENRDCLHCHGPAKRYREAHVNYMEDIESGVDTCLSCHDVGHLLPEGK